MTDRENKKRQYRTDPKYRQQQLAATATYHRRMLADPVRKKAYKRLNHIRKRISQRRDQIETHLDTIARYERDLIRLIVERDSLAARLKGQSLASSERAAKKRKCAV